MSFTKTLNKFKNGTSYMESHLLNMHVPHMVGGPAGCYHGSKRRNQPQGLVGGKGGLGPSWTWGNKGKRPQGFVGGKGGLPPSKHKGKYATGLKVGGWGGRGGIGPSRTWGKPQN